LEGLVLSDQERGRQQDNEQHFKTYVQQMNSDDLIGRASKQGKAEDENKTFTNESNPIPKDIPNQNNTQGSQTIIS